LLVIALAGGSLIFVVVVVAILFAIAFSYYSRRGRDINAHPHGGGDEAPGASGPSEVGGRGRIPEDPAHPDEGRIPTHGTK
jgi:hypothetical protein